MQIGKSKCRNINVIQFLFFEFYTLAWSSEATMLVCWTVTLFVLHCVTATSVVPSPDPASNDLSSTFGLGYLCGICSAICTFCVVGESKAVWPYFVVCVCWSSKSHHVIVSLFSEYLWNSKRWSSFMWLQSQNTTTWIASICWWIRYWEVDNLHIGCMHSFGSISK